MTAVETSGSRVGACDFNHPKSSSKPDPTSHKEPISGTTLRVTFVFVFVPLVLTALIFAWTISMAIWHQTWSVVTSYSSADSSIMFLVHAIVASVALLFLFLQPVTGASLVASDRSFMYRFHRMTGWIALGFVVALSVTGLVVIGFRLVSDDDAIQRLVSSAMVGVFGTFFLCRAVWHARQSNRSAHIRDIVLGVLILSSTGFLRLFELGFQFAGIDNPRVDQPLFSLASVGVSTQEFISSMSVVAVVFLWFIYLALVKMLRQAPLTNAFSVLALMGLCLGVAID